MLAPGSTTAVRHAHSVHRRRRRTLCGALAPSSGRLEWRLEWRVTSHVECRSHGSETLRVRAKPEGFRDPTKTHLYLRREISSPSRGTMGRAGSRGRFLCALVAILAAFASTDGNADLATDIVMLSEQGSHSLTHCRYIIGRTAIFENCQRHVSDQVETQFHVHAADIANFAEFMHFYAPCRRSCSANGTSVRGDPRI